jgi:hypothetical protein
MPIDALVDDRVTERLADFGADPRTDHHRDATEQRPPWSSSTALLHRPVQRLALRAELVVDPNISEGGVATVEHAVRVDMFGIVIGTHLDRF